MNTPEYYRNRQNELNERYFIVLNEIVAMFPKFKSQPVFQAYATSMQADTANLQTLQIDFVSLYNDLEKDISTLETELIQVDNEIGTLEEENNELKSHLSSLANSNNASVGMLNDTELLHNQYLFGNWILFSVFIAAGWFVYKHRIKPQ